MKREIAETRIRRSLIIMTCIIVQALKYFKPSFAGFGNPCSYSMTNVDNQTLVKSSV
jgi:hypothetical protein